MYFDLASIGTGWYSEGTTIAISGVILFLLFGARLRRVRNAAVDRRPHGAMLGVVYGFFAIAEVVSTGLAWLLCTHVSMPVGSALGLVFGTLIGASTYALIHTRVSNQVPEVFRPFFLWIRRRPAHALAAAAGGFIVGFIFGSVARGLLLSLIAVGIAEGVLSGRDARLSEGVRQNLAENVAASLGVSIVELAEMDWGGDSAGNIIVSRPGKVLLNADRLESRVARLMPRFEISECSPARIVFSPLSHHGADVRAHTELSGGLITGSSAGVPTPTAAPSTPVKYDADVPTYTINLEDLEDL